MRSVSSSRNPSLSIGQWGLLKSPYFENLSFHLRNVAILRVSLANNSPDKEDLALARISSYSPPSILLLFLFTPVAMVLLMEYWCFP